MLEACRGEDKYLLAESKPPYQIIGISRKEEMDKLKNGNCSIRFCGMGEWELRYGEELLLRYRLGSYCINNEKEYEAYERRIEEIKEIKGDNNKKIFVKILECLRRQPHGALMILMNDKMIKEEAERLGNRFKQGTSLNKALDLSKKENRDIFLGIAGIDGAVFVSYDGKCYGFGMMLDGKAIIEGEMGRGSRYNSCMKYLADKKEGYAVIVSEDKERGIEIYPKKK